jgi:hypothetical protein
VTRDSKADATARDIQDFENIVTVLVSPEEKRFIIHQEEICDKSKFFKAACSKSWIEGQERLIRLSEVKAEVIQCYSNWIYSGTVPAIRITPTSKTTEISSEHNLFVSFYVVGDSLEDVQLRNLATQRFCKSLKVGDKLPDNDVYAAIWSSTPHGSRLRKQLVNIVVAKSSRNSFAKDLAGKPAEFVQGVAIAAMQSAPIIAWEAVVDDNAKSLEPEEAEDGAV